MPTGETDLPLHGGRAPRAAARSPAKILLEGRPGTGKTTVARRLVELLLDADLRVSGFTTEELRESGRRVGFAIEDVHGRRATLAHVEQRSDVRVGRYGVDIAALEDIALPALEAAGDVVVIDELGKMELASQGLKDAMSRHFEGDGAIVATVHAFRHPFTDALKGRPDVEVIRVTTRNRDELAHRLAARLRTT